MAARTIPTARFAPPGAVFAQAWSLVWEMLEARRSRRVLMEMDGRLLADIGISRGDARTEAARPMWDLSPPRR